KRLLARQPVIFELLPQRTLVEFTHTRLGNRLDEYDIVRQPPLGHFRPQEIEDLIFGDLIPELREWRYAGHWALLPLGVEHTDYRSFRDLGMRHDGVLKTHAGNPLAAALHQILGAVHDLDVTLCIDRRDISGPQPALREGIPALRIVVVFAGHPGSASLQ